MHGDYHTSAFVAVLEMSRSPVVSRTNNSTFSNKDATHSPLHAITPLCSEGRQLHKVLIPMRSKTLIIGQIQIPNGSMQLFKGGRGIEKTHLGPVGQIGAPNVFVVQVSIIPENKLLESGWFELSSPASAEGVSPYSFIHSFSM